MNNSKIPKLRFPEFHNAPEWEEKTLGEVALNLDNKREAITEKDRTKGNIPYYGATGVIDHVKDFIFNEELLCISEDGANLVDRNYPIAFTISGKTWVNNHAHVLKFYYKATQVLVQNYINLMDLNNFLTGQAQPKLNKAMLDSIPIALPKPFEQQKIADCLSTLDDLIAAENKKLSTLKLHKKGLMQKLFPKNSETVPELRFAEFRDCGEWVEKSLKDLCQILGGGTPATQKSEYWTGDYPWISSSDLIENNIFKINVTRYISKDAIDNSATKIIEKNSVIIVSRVGVGKVALNSLQLCTSQDFTNLTQIKGIPVFWAYYMSHKMLKEAKNSQGTSIKGITVEVIKNYSVSVPTLPEQQKIADCLSSLDELITAQAKKIEALKLHKKGLMQGLFVKS